VRPFRFAATALAVASALPLFAQQPTVKITPYRLNGPRELKDETRTAVIRDYLEAWQSLRTALAKNQPAALDRDFIGDARDGVSATIRDQITTGTSTRYLDTNHDLQVVFYSPEGLSVELVDTVTYDVQFVDHGKVVATATERGRYVVVMTPAETRWRVRIFQGGPVNDGSLHAGAFGAQ